MAKVSFISAEQPLAPDLVADRAVLRTGGASRHRDIVFVICESLTDGPCHAIDITREAICEGADAIIAVGGDIIVHKGGKPVTNNDSTAVHTTALGLILLGTGSAFGLGMRSHIDIGFIRGESGEPHYFINVTNAHLSAKAGHYASRYKRSEISVTLSELCKLFLVIITKTLELRLMMVIGKYTPT